MGTRLKKAWTGNSPHRLERERLERAFAQEWQEQNETSHTLDYMLSDETNRCKSELVSDRDRFVACTFAQWLGSPVGQCFLAAVKKRAGRMKG